MIKINEISPLDPKSKYETVSDLENDYLTKFRKNKKPEDLIQSFLNTKVSRDYKNSTKVQQDILNYLYNSFPKIIKGKPKELKIIIEHFKNNKWQEEVFCEGKNSSCSECKSSKKCKGKTTKFGKEILYILGYKERFRSSKRRGLWLVNQLNIKTCPYCNAQNTLVTGKDFGEQVIKFQLDHFFPKSKYPYLSISLYNLIPSCASCNLTKSDKDVKLTVDYNPYDMDLAKKSKFYLPYIPNPSLLTIKSLKKQKQPLKIKFVSKYKDPLGIVKEHNKTYHIDGVYCRHLDVVEELMILAVMHAKLQTKTYLKIRGLFSNKEDYQNFLLRNYSLKKDILKRPLAKMNQDIAKQLKLIK